MELKISDDHVYAIGKLNARQQFHVARKIGPAVFALTTARAQVMKALPGGMPKDDEAFSKVAEEALGSVFKGLAEALAQMSEADVDYLINICMSACQRKQQGGWQNVIAPNGSFMFDDIDVKILLRLTLEVIKENLGSFFAAPLEAIA